MEEDGEQRLWEENKRLREEARQAERERSEMQRRLYERKLEDKECEVKELKRENADLKDRLHKLEWKHGEEAWRWVTKWETMRVYLKREEELPETLLAEAKQQREASEATLRAEKAAVEVAMERWKERARAGAMKVPQAPKGVKAGDGNEAMAQAGAMKVLQPPKGVKAGDGNEAINVDISKDPLGDLFMANKLVWLDRTIAW